MQIDMMSNMEGKKSGVTKVTKVTLCLYICYDTETRDIRRGY
jgi:hypothetical protein